MLAQSKVIHKYTSECGITWNELKIYLDKIALNLSLLLYKEHNH